KNVKKRHPITLQHPEAKFLLPLIEKEQISYNTRRFRFGLPSPDHAFGLPVGNYVNLLARIDGVLVIRAYTPVSSDEDLGFVDLIMKVNDARHVQRGKMTQYLENMKTGDTILFQGPSGRLFYHGSGTGGFTLGLQLGGRRCLWLFHCSRKLLRFESHGLTEEEILVSKELEEVARTHPKQFNLWYTLDGPTVGWKYSSGFITEDTIKEHLPPPGRFSFIPACGPPPLIQRAAHPNLEKLGYNKDMIFTY
uniref:cytochrome-b5 reductase n=1 Tax=Balaenoptera musculus TaxID=9771 RepID=A0A8C0CSK0_BALMU